MTLLQRCTLDTVYLFEACKCGTLCPFFLCLHMIGHMLAFIKEQNYGKSYLSWEHDQQGNELVKLPFTALRVS